MDTIETDYDYAAISSIQPLIRAFFATGPVIFFKWGNRFLKRGRPSQSERWGIDYISANITQMGYKLEDFSEKKTLLIDMIHPDDRQAIIDGQLQLCRNHKGKNTFMGEFRLLAPTGKISWVYLHTAASRDVTGNRCCYYSYFIDRSAEKKGEEAIAILARFPDESPNPVLRLKRDGGLVYANDAALSLIEKWEHETGKRQTVFCTHLLNRLLQTATRKELEIEIGERIFLFILTPVADTDYIYLYGSDITEKKVAEKELKLAAIVYESSIQGIIVTGPDALIQSVNLAFTQITGYTADEVLGKNPSILKANRHDTQFYKDMWAKINETGKWQGEIWNRRKNGDTFPELLSINTIKDNNGQVIHYVAVFNDIVELKQRETEMEYQAYHDPLTGLPNRSLFNDRLKMEISRMGRSVKRLKLGVMFLDLDNFKDINDSLGHAIGDYLLKDVAQRLLECVRDVDTVARIGGDEFTVILPQVSNSQEIVLVVNRIMDIFKGSFFVQGHELFTTASIGISIYPTDGKDTSDLLKTADLAMYHAKELGKNNYAFFSQEMNVQIKTRLNLENQLRHALNEGQFVLHYQPLVEICSGNMVGVEALVRWNHPELGLIPPDRFIPLAEETGQILKLGQWVLETSCQQTLRWQKENFLSLYVSVNVSSIQFLREDFLATIQKVIDSTGIRFNTLSLQVTENSLMGNLQKIVAIMNSLKEIGIKLSIDDFGMGFSSLNYLRTFPVDTLKIDRTFIAGIPHNSDHVAITRSIIALAKNLKLNVLAEGVENEEQLDFLVKNNCDLMQGYYYSPAVPPEEITRIIREKKNLYQ